MTIANTSMPRASQAFVEFAQILRKAGFAVAPEQTSSFIEAIGLLGPKNLSDINRAGRAMLSIPRDRQGEYDALFRAFFMGQTVSAPMKSDEDEDELQAFDEREGEQDIEIAEEENEIGDQASTGEVLSNRRFELVGDDAALFQFTRLAEANLPRRRSYRRRSTKHGDRFDMRRSLRQAVRRDGEVFDLLKTRRKTRQRPIVLLIDVSGSMKEQSENTMRFAHALMMEGERVEVFTFGTRLTRITRSLNDRMLERALENVSRLVADFDGGTRIGDALDALLSVPRFSSTMRGASVVIVSDGLERGDPSMMVDAVKRLSRISWRLDWLSPLAGAQDFAPSTEALSACLPWLTALGDGSSIQSISTHVLAMAKSKPRRLQRIAA